MAKTTKPRNDWDAIKLDNASGKYTLRELGVKYNTSYTSIYKKAKKEGWLNEKKLVQANENLAEAVVEMIEENKHKYPKVVELQEKVHNTVMPHQIEQVDKDIAMLALHKYNASTLAAKILKYSEMYVDQLPQILASHKNGLYKTSEKADGTVTYDRSGKYITDVVPLLDKLQQAMGVNAAQVAIQNNVNSGNANNPNDDSVVKFYIPDNGREKK
jgi:hypothetical protein